MKAILLSLFVGLMMVGCEELSTPKAIGLDDKETLDKIIAEAIDKGKLQKRGKKGEELAYAPNEQTPYTGWAKIIYDNGQIRVLSQLKDGKLDGLETVWDENGQKEVEGNYKDGKLHGLRTAWHENGQKWLEANYKDGEQDGLQTGWYENEQKWLEANWKDGKFISAKAWKPNGEKCPFTNLKDGNGVAVMYEEDGTEEYRFTYKDGEVVKD